jgi:glycerol kinase
MFGLTRGTVAGHLARAALESIAYQVADLLDAMQRDAGTPLRELRVDGGAAANETLLQFQADILGIPVVRSAVMETTALGAAFLAGIAVGFWHDASAIAALPLKEKRFEPHMPRSQAEALRGRWNQALSRAKAWEVNP